MNLSQDKWVDKQRADSNSVILDVRSEEEFESGHILGAKLLDIRQPREFMNAVSALDKEKTYFVYCRSGTRSAQACQLMKAQGIEKVYNLLGGILDWKGETE